MKNKIPTLNVSHKTIVRKSIHTFYENYSN